jgi:hypothetical protein
MRAIWISVALAAVLASHAFAAQPAELTSWDSQTDGSPKTYTLGGYRLTLSAANDDDFAAPVLDVAAPGLPPISLKGEEGGRAARAEFGVATLAPGSKPSVIFATYSGGAHCCTGIVVLRPAGDAWQEIDMGSWDGGGLGGLPKDVDGDGIADFVFVDNAFLYSFDSYAGSWAPPLVLNIVDGKARNVSATGHYAALYRADMEKARLECAKHQNGACAAFVADAARIGRYDAAWKFMLAHYDRKSDWDYPTRCDVAMIDGQCKGHKIEPSGFPQALQWFLQDNGYIAD